MITVNRHASEINLNTHLIILHYITLYSFILYLKASVSHNDWVNVIFDPHRNSFGWFLTHITLLLLNKKVIPCINTTLTRRSSPLLISTHMVPETQPPVWNFMRAPCSSGLIVGYVPRLSLALDDGIVAWCPLKKDIRTKLSERGLLCVCVCLNHSPENESFSPGWSDWAPAGVLAATWRRGVAWHCPGDTPCDPSSGPGSRSYSGSQNAVRHRAGTGHPLSWDQDSCYVASLQ